MKLVPSKFSFGYIKIYEMNKQDVSSPSKSCINLKNVAYPLLIANVVQERREAAVRSGLDITVEVKPQHSLIAVQGSLSN